MLDETSTNAATI